MTDKKYNDPVELAKCYYTLNEEGTATYQEIADELGCSVGTISMRFNEEYYPDIVEEIQEMGPEDFEAGDYVEELDELTEEEVYDEVWSFLASNFTEPDTDKADIHSEPLMLRVLVRETNIGGAIEEGYGLGIKNPCVAVSQHLCSDVMVDRFNDEAIGLISVGYDRIEVKSECNLTIGSGIRAIFGDFAPEVSYQQAGWLNYKVNSEEVELERLCEECDLLPRTVMRLLDRFDLEVPSNWR